MLLVATLSFNFCDKSEIREPQSLCNAVYAPFACARFKFSTAGSHHLLSFGKIERRMNKAMACHFLLLSEGQGRRVGLSAENIMHDTSQCDPPVLNLSHTRVTGVHELSSLLHLFPPLSPCSCSSSCCNVHTPVHWSCAVTPLSSLLPL